MAELLEKLAALVPPPRAGTPAPVDPADPLSWRARPERGRPRPDRARPGDHGRGRGQQQSGGPRGAGAAPGLGPATGARLGPRRYRLSARRRTHAVGPANPAGIRRFGADRPGLHPHLPDRRRPARRPPVIAPTRPPPPVLEFAAWDRLPPPLASRMGTGMLAPAGGSGDPASSPFHTRPLGTPGATPNPPPAPYDPSKGPQPPPQPHQYPHPRLLHHV